MMTQCLGSADYFALDCRSRFVGNRTQSLTNYEAFITVITRNKKVVL